MGCNTVRDNLVAYEAGALDEQARRAVEAHLSGCPACRAELEAEARMTELLAPVAQTRAPANMWSGVKSRLRPRRAGWRSLLVPVWRPVAAAGLAAALVLGGVLVGARAPAFDRSGEMLASDLQERQIVAQWSEPLADDAALGAMFAGLSAGEESRQ